MTQDNETFDKNVLLFVVSLVVRTIDVALAQIFNYVTKFKQFHSLHVSSAHIYS